MTTPNLWGDLPDVENIRTPVQILREQAVNLGAMTKGVLDARVDAVGTDKDNRTWWTLSIFAPALKDYRFQAATIMQPVTLYPVVFTNGFIDSPTAVIAASEEEFVERLQQLLTSARVRDAIKALLVQSRG